MGVRRILGGGVALVALALVAPAAASADDLLEPSGALIYTWHGDPARGCAAVGVCGYQGELIVRPSSPAFFFSPGSGVPSTVDIGGANATVRVRRIESGSTGDCIDTVVWPNLGDSALAVSWRSDGRARLTIASADGPSSGRCAGPQSGDLGGSIAGRTTGAKHRAFAFLGTSTFVAGPYSGTLVSTLAFRPAPSSGVSSSGSFSGPPGGQPRTAPFERVTIRLDAVAPVSVLRFSFHGDTDPACVVFDTCATSGTIGLTLGATRASLMVIAQRRVARPVSRDRALADFRAGRLNQELPLGSNGAIVRTAETVTRTGGAMCSDTNSSRSQTMLWLGSPFQPGTGPRLPVVITVDTNLTGMLRTHCPGPGAADVYGAAGFSMGGPLVLARGSIDMSHLLARHSLLIVSGQGGFASPGYRGSRGGEVTLRLSLVKVSAGTVWEPVG